MTPASEQQRLNLLGANTDYAAGLNRKMISEFIFASSPFFYGERFLEMGSADGTSTEVLLEFSKNLELLEGSSPLSENLSRKFPQLVIHNCLFENFNPKQNYDTIIMSHVLEHVQSPLEILKQALNWLSPKGKIIINSN